ncbi:MAG TPA: hypothetical protein VG122_21220 [Gemmata sp.]|jgi:hypothetical protein|nr:hypothetical protein [Gemmata sp.]
MSKQTKDFFEQLKAGQEPSLVESIKEAAAPLKEIGGQLWDGMKPMFDHGRSELSAALFNNSPFVLYMKSPEGVEQSQEQGRDEPQQQQEQGGREL